MAKINVKGARTAPTATGPIATVAKNTVTYEGAPAYTRDAKSELFLLAVSQFAGEQTFYEKANDRTTRLVNLVQAVAHQADGPEWLMQFLPWLRKSANIRTAAIIGAVEAARALREKGQPGQEPGYARQVLRDTITRADEPAEALAYYLNAYGRKLPKPVQRGIADAAERLYNERNVIKWDGGSAAVRMADVLELTHPKPKAPWQSTLFKYILDSRRNSGTEIDMDALPMLSARALLLAGTEAEKKAVLAAPDAADMLNTAGMTWEQVSSWGAFTARTWEALIPTMGYMALIRNLRNFQEAGISVESMAFVAAKLSNPEEVAKSRQLPFRFLSAYLEATNAFWALPLEKALELSTKNIPSLPGRTLVLVDTSGSMTQLAYSAKSKIKPVQAGALFGIALAAKGEQVDLYGFDNNLFPFTVKRGGSVLRQTEEFSKLARGGGTETAKALKATWKDHDRVVIVTDEQTFGPRHGFWQGNVSDQIPQTVPIYSFNMAGYAPSMMETSATRHQLGGLTDSTFAMISLLEAGQQAKWPWLTVE
jgi:TROVE domain